MLLLVALLLALAPAAQASGWQERTLTADNPYPAPHAAIGADGTNYAAYLDRRHLLVARGAGKPVAFSFAESFAVAAGPHGQGAIAYEARDGLHLAIRLRERFSDRLLVREGHNDLNAVAVAYDPGDDSWIVVEAGEDVRVVALNGVLQDLGEGFDPSLSIDRDGTAHLVFDSDEGTVRATRPPHGRFGDPIAVNATEPQEPRLQRHTLAGLEPVDCGDAGCFGRPVSGPVDGRLTGPQLGHPSRDFDASATSRVLVYQQKDKPAAFSLEAPVWAYRHGRTTRLTHAKATEPVALALDGRALILWATRAGWGAASVTRWLHRVGAPSGAPPSPNPGAEGNRAAAAAGEYAIVAWSRGKTIEVAVRHFPDTSSM